LDPYDRIPYLSLPITDTHPDHLAVLGRLFGLATSDPANCRVLELGCAGGGNLIPMAFHLPGSRFVGIDLSAAQVAQGAQLIERLGLANIELRQGDILDLDAEALGRFDFVIAHGVYSWVPPSVRERLLALSRDLLAPAGVLYLSYNTLPGWRMRGMLRDMLRHACSGVTEPEAQLAAAYRALERLDRAVAGQQGITPRFLREEAARLRKAPPSYLLFEYLAEHNHPFLFSEFLADTARHGLRYLCDTDLAQQFPATHGAGVEAALADVAEDMEVEQWLDFVSCRAFRQSLLVREDTAGSGPSDGAIDLARFAGLAFDLELQAPSKLDLRRERAEAWLRPDGERVEIRHPLTKAVCRRLVETRPARLPLAELLPEAQAVVRAVGGGALAGDAEGALLELFSLFAHGTLRAGLQPQRFSPTSERPAVIPLLRAMVAAGQVQVPTLRHGSMELDPLAARLALLLDGTLTLVQAAEQLAAEIADGALTPPKHAAAGGGTKEQLRDRVGRLCRDLVMELHRQGVVR